MDFPIERAELDAIKHGRRHDAVVPVSPEAPPAVGDTVTFQEATSDPFGNPVLVPNGDAVSVDLTEVRNQGHKWAGQDLYLHCLGSSRGEKKAEGSGQHSESSVKSVSMGKMAATGAVASFRELHTRLSSYGKDWIFRGHADAEVGTHPQGGAQALLGT